MGDIPSAFEGLEIEKELVCDFFATFSRLEYSLKELNCTRNDHGVIAPAWWRFAEEMSEKIHVKTSSDLESAIEYLCHEPPLVQVGSQTWEARPLHGNSLIEKAIDAACRVRNNLFHGGKHTPHSPSGRDQKLVGAALEVLRACVISCEQVYEVYVNNRF